MLTNPHSEPFQPANRPPYVAFAQRLDDRFEEAEESLRTRSAATASKDGGTASPQDVEGTTELDAEEVRATRGLRTEYGWFGAPITKESTRTTYRYPDAEQ